MQFDFSKSPSNNRLFQFVLPEKIHEKINKYSEKEQTTKQEFSRVIFKAALLEYEKQNAKGKDKELA